VSDSGGGVPAPRPEGGNLPARRLNSQELEAVIRRAVELQTASSVAREDGISEGEVLRIGQELGLEPAAVRRAITEVRGRPPEERGALARAMGPAMARSARTVRRPAAATGLLLEEYLCRCEYMVVQRRFPDRTRYVRDTGIAAGFGRLARSFGRNLPPLDLAELDVAVSALDEDSCVVELSVDMGGMRAGMAAGGALGGGAVAGGIATAVLATPLIDPLALLALPALATSWFGMRGIYRATRGGVQEKLESFLDRLEHGEVRVPPPRGSDPFGLGSRGGRGRR
jgi:hypothetical protein